MPNPKPLPVTLTDAERQGLERLVRRHTVGQHIALRGRIVLAAAAGKNNTQIAKEEGVTLDTVRLWRQRWLDLQPICPFLSFHGLLGCYHIWHYPGFLQKNLVSLARPGRAKPTII